MQNLALVRTLEETGETLQMFVERQKSMLVKKIIEHADLDATELAEMDLDKLRFVKKTAGYFALM
jgi:hypothetical protein